MSKSATTKSAKHFGACLVCSEVFDRRRRNEEGRVVGTNYALKTCPKHRWSRHGEVLIDRETPYRDDVACQLFVATFRGGATLDSIAEALGVSRERVRQIEGEALKKIRAQGLPAFDIDPFDPSETRTGRARHDEPGGSDDEEQDEEDDDAQGGFARSGIW